MMLPRFVFAGLTAPALAIALAVTVAVPPAFADFKRTLTAQLQSAYVFRGIDRAELIGLYSGEVELGAFYAEGLRIEPVGADGDLFPVETRARLGWRPTSFNGDVEWDFGTQVFRRNLRGTSDPDHSVEAFAGMDIYAPLNPAVRVYYDLDENILTTEAGLFQYLALPLDLSLETTADAGMVRGFDTTFQDYVYVQGQANIVRSFLYGFEAYAGVRGAYNSEGALLDDDAQLWYGAGASWTF